MFAGSASWSRWTRASSRTRVQVLSPEQTAALPLYHERWTALRRATAGADRDTAEEGVRLAYRAAGLKSPQRFVWCGGPVELADVTRQIARADGPNVRRIVIDRMRRHAHSAIRRCVGAGVYAEATNAIDAEDGLAAAAWAAVIRSSDRERPRPLLRIAPAFSWWARRNVLSPGLGLRHGAAGQHDLAWLGTCEYFHDVCALQAETAALSGLWLFAKSAGWIMPHEHTCWLTERYDILSGDAGHRLHNASGPALRFPDGWSLYAWKGVRVPAWIIEQPERITLHAIDNEANVQVRRCMIDIMTPERYVAMGGAVRAAEDETGILWRKSWWTFDSWAAVEVINGTAGPDGKRKHYFLQVPAWIRTAREAVAWTYGLSEEQYARLTHRT